jgi:hypothetical protein
LKIYDRIIKNVSNLSGKQLDEVVPSRGVNEQKATINFNVRSSNTSPGQMIVYVRLKGIKPPDYIGWWKENFLSS